MECQVDTGFKYRGHFSTTKGGFKCQAWNVDFPHNTQNKGGKAHFLLTRAVGVPVSRRLGWRLAITLVAMINNILFFPPSFTFLIDGVLGLKTYLAKVDRSAQNPRG